MVSGDYTILLQHVIMIRTSCFDTDFASQIKFRGVAEWLAWLARLTDMREVSRIPHPASAEPCMWGSDRQPCWLQRGRQVLHQRCISGNVYHVCLCQVRIRLPTLALKPRGDVIRSPKQGHQWPHKKELCPPKIFKNKKFRSEPKIPRRWGH